MSVEADTLDVLETIGQPADGEEPGVASLKDVYLDGTLVLVGCGKAKRDPDDPTDLHQAVITPENGEHYGPIEDGPAWRAEDLYTSTYFASKRDFARTVTGWTGDAEETPWAILSAEHKLLFPWEVVETYDTTIGDLGDDPQNPEHRLSDSMRRRRPDGREIVTELDQWATMVAHGLARWLSMHREDNLLPHTTDANELLVLAGQDYIQPLRERGVFKYGASRCQGNPNDVHELDVEVRFLFEEIDAGGIGEQMAWLSDAVDRLDNAVADTGTQNTLGQWTGQRFQCDVCGASPQEAGVRAFGDLVGCQEHQPRRCARCNEWTRETGMGVYPLCSACQTDRGGRMKEPVNEEETDQIPLTNGEEVCNDGE